MGLGTSVIWQEPYAGPMGKCTLRSLHHLISSFLAPAEHAGVKLQHCCFRGYSLVGVGGGLRVEGQGRDGDRSECRDMGKSRDRGIPTPAPGPTLTPVPVYPDLHPYIGLEGSRADDQPALGCS